MANTAATMTGRSSSAGSVQVFHRGRSLPIVPVDPGIAPVDLGRLRGTPASGPRRTPQGRTGTVSAGRCGQAVAVGGDVASASVFTAEPDAVKEATASRIAPLAALAVAGSWTSGKRFDNRSVTPLRSRR